MEDRIMQVHAITCIFISLLGINRKPELLTFKKVRSTFNVICARCETFNYFFVVQFHKRNKDANRLSKSGILKVLCSFQIVGRLFCVLLYSLQSDTI